MNQGALLKHSLGARRGRRSLLLSVGFFWGFFWAGFLLVERLPAQSLMVLPVSIQMAPGQRAASVVVTNEGSAETTVQVRAFAWNQTVASAGADHAQGQDHADGEDQLLATTGVLVSPPMITIAPGAKQVIRLVLRAPAQNKEATYRILLDQMPPPAVPGLVQVVLRLSIPIFAEPAAIAVPHLRFSLVHDDGKLFLVALNDGQRHEMIREFSIATLTGEKLKAAALGSQYVLAGATRRWRVEKPDMLRDSLLLTGRTTSGLIDQQVSFASVP